MDVVSWRWRWRDGGRNQLMGWMDKVLARAPKPFAHNAVVHVARAHCGPPLCKISPPAGLWPCRPRYSSGEVVRWLVVGQASRCWHEVVAGVFPTKPGELACPRSHVPMPRSRGSRGGCSPRLPSKIPPLFHTACRHGRVVCVSVCGCCWCWQILLVRNHTLSATPASATLARDASPRSASKSRGQSGTTTRPVPQTGVTGASHSARPSLAVESKRSGSDCCGRGPAPGFMLFDPHGGPGRQQQVNGQGLFLSFFHPQTGHTDNSGSFVAIFDVPTSYRTTRTTILGKHGILTSAVPLSAAFSSGARRGA